MCPSKQTATLALGRFTTPLQQISNVLQWNEALGLGLIGEDIETIPQDVLNFAWDDPLISLTLCWTLGTLEETLNAKLAVIRHTYGERKVSVSPECDAKHVFLVEGAPAFRSSDVWWQVLDLGANRGKSPNQVPAATAAGTEVFDNICQHPAYLLQHNGTDTPHLDVPGLRIQLHGESWGLCAPYICGGSQGVVKVRVPWAGYGYSFCAEPVRVAEVTGHTITLNI